MGHVDHAEMLKSVTKSIEQIENGGTEIFFILLISFFIIILFYSNKKMEGHK